MNANIEVIVLKNLKDSINLELDKLIEVTTANVKYQSKELSEDYFHSLAYSKYIQTLLKEATLYTERLPMNKF